MSVRLIVRADDAAGSIAANRAISEALAGGVVRNVSVMGCGHPVVWKDWVSYFFALPASVRESIDVGLHVTLNAEWSTPSVRFRPCLGADQVPSLVEGDTGFFTSSPADLYQRGWGPRQVEESIAEVAAQLQRLRADGLEPVYLDEHMGVGWLSGLRDALAEFACKEGLIAVERLNLPSLTLPALTGSDDASALASACLASLESADSSPLPYLLVAHPASDGPETRYFFNADIAPGVVAVEREQERRVLTGADLIFHLQKLNTTLMRFSDMARAV